MLYRPSTLCRSVLIAAALLVLASVVIGERFPDGLKARFDKISSGIYNDRFEQAELSIESLREIDSNLVFCYLFRAILYQSQMMAAESEFLEDEFFDALDSLEYKAKLLLEQGSDSAMAYYFLGQNYAFRSLHHGRAGRTWKAIKKGLAAGKTYTKGYKIDPTFHDIAFGLGSYRYWKSVKTGVLNWTPLFKNEKANGIMLLRLAADSSEISKDAALAALIWVNINEGFYDRAISLADRMHSKYPSGLTFLWALGQAYFEDDNFAKAAGIYETILSRLRKQPGNCYNIVEAAFYLSDCYRNLADSEPESLNKLNSLQEEMRSFPIPEKIQKKQKKKLEKVLNEF